MKITKQKTGTTLEIALDDRLDTVTAPELDAEIRKGLLDGVENLVWDFSDLEYITSAGIRVLLQAQRIMFGQGSMKILHANEMVTEVFSLTGLDDMLNEE